MSAQILVNCCLRNFIWRLGPEITGFFDALLEGWCQSDHLDQAHSNTGTLDEPLGGLHRSQNMSPVVLASNLLQRRRFPRFCKTVKNS